jgi:integrase
MKKKREHWVPLSTQVVELLRLHCGVVGEDGPLFPGRSYGGVISDNTLNVALERLGYKGKHTAHGFRATARTILEEHLSVDERYIEKQLAHEDSDKTRRAYNRAEYWDERVKMMQRWSDWLDAQR